MDYYDRAFDDGYNCYKSFIKGYLNSDEFRNLMHDVSVGKLEASTAIEKIKERFNLNTK